MASSCEAPGSWPPSRRSPTRPRSIRPSRCPPAPKRYAVAFAIPLSTRRVSSSCAATAASAPDADPFDKPLSSRFDEQDAFCIFDDVVVPWDRVFIDGDVEIYNSTSRDRLRTST